MIPYQGHSTFRNQPSYKIFNKSFEDPSDRLFLQLNEIDPHFLTEKELNNKKGFLPNDDVIDPRTKKEVEYRVFNYSENKNCRVFKGGGIVSSMTKDQHEICLRVLLRWQERREVDEGDLIVWRQMEGKMKKERMHMHEFIAKYEESHKEEMYAVAKRFDEHYRKWFRARATKLLERHRENISFNTFTGLPHASVCKSVNGTKAEISNVRLLERVGWVRLLNGEEQIGWGNFNFRLADYADYFNEAMTVNDEFVFKEKSTKCLRSDDEPGNGLKYFLPFEAILFLLCAGEYVDLPTECLLEISKESSDDCKTIKFDEPFPARNCGWHTQQQLVEQALTAFLSSTGRSKWLYVENESVRTEIATTTEMNAVNGSCKEFKPHPFESYLEQYYAKAPAIDKQVKCNHALIEWHLKEPDSPESLKILTTLNLPPTLDCKAKKFLAHETLKLEHKPQFGCEVMTKYDLLKAWLKMRLMSFAKASEYGVCYRLSSKDCDIQLREQLTLEAVENYLKQIYHVCPSQLTSNLAEFLKLLCNMPVGKYMLRYNPKYPDKFLLCSPSKEITMNTVYLHSFLQADPTDMAFTTQNQRLPIAEMLCSRVHLKHNILPCAFLPKLPHQKKGVTIEARVKKEKLALQKRQASEELVAKKLKGKIKSVASKKRKTIGNRQRKKKRAQQKKRGEQEAESQKF